MVIWLLFGLVSLTTGLLFIGRGVLRAWRSARSQRG